MEGPQAQQAVWAKADKAGTTLRVIEVVEKEKMHDPNAQGHGETSIRAPKETNIPHSVSITQAEIEARKTLTAELAEHDNLTMEGFNLIGETVATIPENHIQQLSLSIRVGMALLARIADDLRCLANLARVGYPLQALTLTNSLYESAFTVAYTASDEMLAQQWRDHNDPTSSFRSIYELTIGGLRNLKLGLTEEHLRRQADTEYKVYRQLCWAKHVNPVLQKQFGYRVEEETPAVVFENGPSTSKESVRALWFALEHGVALAGIALAAFARHHVPEDHHETLMAKHEELGRKRQELAAQAKARWGTEDPFPGKW